jgi:hypothetical protein
MRSNRTHNWIWLNLKIGFFFFFFFFLNFFFIKCVSFFLKIVEDFNIDD